MPLSPSKNGGLKYVCWTWQEGERARHKGQEMGQGRRCVPSSQQHTGRGGRGFACLTIR